MTKMILNYSGIKKSERYKRRQNQGIKDGEIKLTFRQKTDKENERISRSRGNRGERGRISKPEREKYRERKKGEVEGLVMGERWQDIETGECLGEESETQR